MNKLEALTALRDKVKAGKPYETMGHTLLCQRAFPKPKDFDGSRKAYASSAAQQAILVWRNGSLDAAKALHEAVLPYSVWIVGGGCVNIYGPNKGQTHSAFFDDKNPARAWLIAILEALIAQEQDT